MVTCSGRELGFLLAYSTGAHSDDHVVRCASLCSATTFLLLLVLSFLFLEVNRGGALEASILPAE